jgi:hypothetical protein
VANGVFQELVAAEPICQGLGINHQMDENKLQIYPNPATDEFTISVGTEFIGKTYNIIDQFGRVVKTGIIASEKHQISIDGIERGAYKFNIDNQWFKKVIIN